MTDLPELAPHHPRPSDATWQQQKKAAYANFMRWATDPDLLVLDTETTGLHGVVWELSALDADGVVPLNFVCNVAGHTWESKALDMHRHRQDEINGAPDRKGFLKAVHKTLSQKHCVSYGADFDGPAINRTFGVEFNPALECVMRAYAVIAGKWSQSRGEWKFVKLTAACEAEGIDTSIYQTHRALDDVMLTMLLIRAVAARQGAT